MYLKKIFAPVVITASLVVAGGGTSSARIATADPAPAANIGDVVASPMEELLELLESLFAMLGGQNPLSGQDPPEVWYATITAYYTLNGVPPGLTPADEADARALVSRTFSTVSNSTSFVGLLPTMLFKATLESMYADLGGNPADLG